MKKEKLAKKLGLDYNEVKDLLSEDTLKSMELNEIKGGDAPQTTCGGLFEKCISLGNECKAGGCLPLPR